MNNSKKITAEMAAPLFGEVKEKSQIISGKELEGLSDKGLAFDGYTLREGDIVEFPKFEEMLVKSNPINKDSNTLVYFVACERTRRNVKIISWFNVNSLAKRNIDNEPVYLEFYELGNIKARLEKLAEIGKITCTGMQDVTVQKFVGNVPQYHDETQEDGTIVSVRTPTVQKCAVLSY